MWTVAEIVISVALGLAVVRFGLEAAASAFGWSLSEPAADDEDTFGF